MVGHLQKLKKECLNYNINLNIIVIEQDSYPVLNVPFSDSPFEDIDYIFIKNSGYYNRGWSFNVGYKKFSDSDYFFFSDNDIVLNKNELLNVFVDCCNYDAVNPYSSIYDSHETIFKNTEKHIIGFSEGTMTIGTLLRKKLIDKDGRSDTCLSGGIVGVSKSAMRLINGWDERFRGRGWEDYAFTAKLRLFFNRIRTYDYDALHLYHECDQNTTREINQKLHQEYLNYTVQDYVTQIVSTIVGNPSKYEEDEDVDGSSYECECYDVRSLNKCIYVAISRYNALKCLVQEKHPECCDNITNIIYFNLIGLHDCCTHDVTNDCVSLEESCS